MELLSPAGGPSQLRAAIRFGADAVYLGGGSFGLRERADKFSLSQIAEAVDLAHASGVKVYATVNALVHPADLASLEGYLERLSAIPLDGLIASDLGVMRIARRRLPAVPLHISTQVSCTNAEAAKFWHEQGARRVVLARELSLAEIAAIRAETPADLELEVFVHGAMCLAYAGRCLISDYLLGRDANRGHCTQPCRWSYRLVEEKRPGECFPIVEDERWSFLLSSTDLCMIEHLEELEEAGVDAIKIEGRMKGAPYVACVTNAYRAVLDGGDPALWRDELDTVSHRPYGTGFFFGTPGQSYGGAEYDQSCDYLGLICEVTPLGSGRSRVAVDLRNRFWAGDELEALTKGHGVIHQIIPADLTDADGLPVTRADRSCEIYRFTTDAPLEEGDLLRRRRARDEEGAGA